MYKKILVPLDGSKTGECTLPHVKAVAKSCQNPEIVLLFVAEHMPAGLYQSEAEVQENLKSFGENYLSETAKMLSAEGIDAKSIIVEGKPAEAIVDYAKETGSDLIIISTHGRSGVFKLAFGSVADEVLKNSPIPCLVIRAQCR